MNPTMQVATRLVELCRQGKSMEAINTLYSPNIVAIEATPMPQFPQRMEGIAAIRRKAEWWEANHDVHSAQADGPWPHGDRFIVRFHYDVTAKAGPMAGKRMNLDEAGLYTVRDGKIVQEEFFYDMGG
jgi:ketosteroid isomerase-like protein